MGRAQRKALAAMRARNLGAILLDGSYRWPQHIRESEAVALLVLDHFGIEE